MSAPEGRAYGALILALGLGLLAAGTALALDMIAAVVGPFDLLARSAPAGAPSLGVWLPASAMEGGRTETRRRARSWRAALGSRVPVRESGSLDALARQGVAALALCDARGLTEPELDALSQWVRAGGSAIVTGPVAVRGRDGGWRGTRAMEQLLGVPRVAPIPREASLALRAARRGPLSAGLGPGQRLATVPELGAPAIDDPGAELRWAGDEAPARAPRGASLRRELGSGRLVWLAAGPELSAAGPTTPGGDFARLAAAAFAWAAREPFAEVLAPVGAPPGAPQAAPEAPGPDLGAEVRRIGPRRHLVEVTNRGRESAREAVVRVHLNAPIRRVAVQRTLLQQQEPSYRFDARALQVDLRVPELAAGRSIAYALDIDPAEGPGA